jgi:hypothetical protein
MYFDAMAIRIHVNEYHKLLAANRFLDWPKKAETRNVDNFAFGGLALFFDMPQI